MILEKIFKLRAHHTSVKTEIMAGLTTFMTIAYIIVINPALLATAGAPVNSMMTATILTIMIASTIMAFFANLPLVVAPGVGVNAFITYTICVGMGKSWPFTLTAVLLTGILFFIIILLNVRHVIMSAIPENLTYAITAGIGLFLATIGLANANIIVPSGALLSLGPIFSGGPASLALIGIFVIAALLIFNIKGALFLGIIITTLIGIPLGVTNLSEFKGVFSHPASIKPVFGQLELANIFNLELLMIVVTLIFVTLFDAMGTVISVTAQEPAIFGVKKAEKKKWLNRAFLTDAMGIMVSSLLGTGSATISVENTTGVASGGRTGLTALVVAILFGITLFLAPLFILIPIAATSSVLFIVGVSMMTSLNKINFKDLTEAIPAFFTIIMMPLSYSIANGIALGLISYALLKIITLRTKEVPIATWIIALVFVFMQLYFTI